MNKKFAQLAKGLSQSVIRRRALLRFGASQSTKDSCPGLPGWWHCRAYRNKIPILISMLAGTCALGVAGRLVAQTFTLLVALLLMQAAQAVSFIPTGSMTTPRGFHTATRLANGKVLVVGGTGNSPVTELYDPDTGSWTATGPTTTERYQHTATLLLNGKVLVAGGESGDPLTGPVSSAELYDPLTGAWAATGSMKTTRANHTATLLPNGTVLVAGGYDGTNLLSTAELYEPVKGVWTATGKMATVRSGHTLTLLLNGQVLAAAGTDGGNPLFSAELYDPDTGGWIPTGSLNVPRFSHTATLLPGGKVLVAGGHVFDFGGFDSLSSAELYDPATGAWTTTGDLTTSRDAHSATLLTSGLVLAVGGQFENIFGYSLSSAELYDPGTGLWMGAAELNTARDLHTATLLPNGQVLIAGGEAVTIQGGRQVLSSAELYDSTPGSWVPTGQMKTARSDHTATLLAGGEVLVAGGFNFASQAEISGAELYNPTNELWTATASLLTARGDHTATLLPSGQVLVAGGHDTNGVLTSAELYDRRTATWAATAPLNGARAFHTATLLSNGQVLVAAGYDGSSALSSAELYDPASETWTPTGDLNVARENHTATLLPNSQVLVAGGDDGASPPFALASAELYDPVSGSWASVGDLQTARWAHTATPLPAGGILIAGGYDLKNPFNTILSGAEIYDPSARNWIPTADLNVARAWHTATLLPNGQVLLAGGSGPFPTFQDLMSSELYDPAAGSWSLTGELKTARSVHTATLLFNGKVLAAGGASGVSTAELYDTQSNPGPIPARPILTNPHLLSGGSFQVLFTGSPSALFSVWASTDPVLPFKNWILLGPAFELSSGLYLFTDRQAVQYPRRFYRVRSP